ncbi:MAG: MraY family glycosyltransferase [Actinomycetota bacterium]|nr:MraY family glycosyltransferase [Actinomycetota bacterium]
MAGFGWYVLVGAIAALVTSAAVPVSRRIAWRVGAVAAPDDRRVHAWPTPTLGGAAMLAGFLAAVAAASLLGAFEPVFATAEEVLGVVAAAVIIYAIGMIDDLREVSAPAKVAGLVLAGSVLSLSGVSILYLRIPFVGLFVLSPDLAALVTVLWVVCMANAINLIDGLDGLAAGVVGIAAVAFWLYGMRLGEEGILRPDNLSPLIAAIIAGVCIGFLPHNFHPATTFMGDGGALLLGVLMASSTIAVGGRHNDPFSGQAYFFWAPLIIPLLILGVPIFDTVFAVIRRAKGRTGLTGADKGHLHHRLMALGHGQRRSVLILWSWTAILSAMVLYPSFTGKGDAVVPLGLVAMGLALYTWFHPGVVQQRRANKEAAANGTAAPTVGPGDAPDEGQHAADDDDLEPGRTVPDRD